MGRAERAGRAKRPPSGAAASAPPARAASISAGERYDLLVRESLETYGVRVKKWRGSMSGIAWQARGRGGAVTRYIEAPRPKGPMSAAVFLHEIGHHAIGFNRYRPRCLEEYHAWAWALREMERRGVSVTEGVRRRMHMSLWYAVSKARRRGLQRLPEELVPFAEAPAPRTRRGRSAGG